VRDRRGWTDELRAIMEEGMEGLRSGDEGKVRRALRRLRRWIDELDPRIFGQLAAGTWYLAGPEGRRTIEEGLKALEEIHPEGARLAQLYIGGIREYERLVEEGILP